jgi:signal transduction histidine kinase
VSSATDDDRVRILLIEDNPGDARLLRETVADTAQGSSQGEFSITHVATLGEALTRLELELFDVALVDLSLPDARGLEALKQVHGRAPVLPIVVLSGLDDESLAVQAVHEGAQDYLVKRHLSDADLLVRLEQAKAEQLRIKDELLSLVSHELRTPLAASYQFVTILLDGLAGDLSGEQRQYLEITLRNLLELRSMVDDLLESNRGQAGIDVQPRPAAAGELLAEALATFSAAADEKDVQLGGGAEPGLPQVLADPVRVHQILGNLLGNALKFTEAGGAVTVTARHLAAERAVAISVADTGEGIPPDALPRVFDRLYQVPGSRRASRRGLGLGLYICRELVLAHGGQLWADSEPGTGSTFTFTLPVAPSGSARGDGQAPDAPAAISQAI